MSASNHLIGKFFVLSAISILFFTAISTGAVRIMPLGDSITEGLGSTGDVGYRRPLYLGLIGMGYDVDFVGSMVHGLYTDFDREHEGHYAWYANQILDNIITFLNNNPADIILLHIGTNDVLDGQPPADVAVEINQILNNIDSYENNHHVTITVVLAMIIDAVPNRPAITTLNYAIQNLYNTRKAAGDHIMLVDMQPVINYSKDMYDSVHPNDNGYWNMAYSWRIAVQQVLSAPIQKTTVPSIIGMDKQSAESAIAGANLAVGTIGTGYSDTILKDFVMTQNPAAGTSVDVGSSVNFVISLGQQPQPVPVPDIINMSQQDAESAITAAQLSVGSITQAYSDTIAKDLVMSQNPPAGSAISVGSPVSFTISLGPEPQKIIVPDITGMSQAQAESAIIAAKLSVGSVTRAYSDTTIKDLVISQNPASGSTVYGGTSISFILSLGKPVVPDVVGMTQTAAAAAITSVDNLKVGTITQQASNTVSQGLIISQSPSAGTAVNTGSSVNLIISLGDAYSQLAANGIVSIEAEQFNANIAQNGRSWTKISSPSGSSGGYAMQALPDSGASYDYPGYLSYSPRLDFNVNFIKTGTHYIWVRGYATSANDDTVHIGLDNTSTSRSTSDKISGFALNTWTWKDITMDSKQAKFNVPSTGVHTVNVWMREDGFRIDKIVLTTNSKYIPTGTGPPITY